MTGEKQYTPHFTSAGSHLTAQHAGTGLMAPVRVFDMLPSRLAPAPVHVLAAQGGNLLLAHTVLVRVYAPLHVHGCFSALAHVPDAGVASGCKGRTSFSA